ncbi:YfcC family protein [Salsuginibacillus kocurii]|uniref:YfcC family protein n=1 Tax=Salsuginibacillus kocurii TaxID=427078 RepID=UPI00036879FF|nr:AbgT family transporter [Salsuginibacillus kocurii]
MEQSSAMKEEYYEEYEEEAQPPEPEKPKKKFKFPHIYVLLVGLIALMTLVSYVIPAGEYERIAGPDGQEMINAEEFSFIEAAPLGIMDVLTAIPAGMIDAGPVVFFTFMIGGTFMVLQSTGLIQFGVQRLTTTFMHRKILIIPILVTAFASIAAFVGTPELSLLYVPILIPLMIQLGYNKMMAAAIALIATSGGFLGSITNPGTVGLSHELAELPMYSGAGYRFLVLSTIILAGILFLIRYAKKLEKQPELVEADAREYYEKNGQKEEKVFKLSGRGKAAGVAAILMFLGMIAGVLTFQWDFVQLAGYFLAMGIVVGVIAGLSGEELSESFNDGFRQVLMGAMIIGIARGVAVVMEESQIIDTVIFALSTIVSQLPSSVTILGMLGSQGFFNFFVPSGSGQAMITMPIMIPLADIVGTTRQTAILAFQLGDGISNILFPTSGYFIATLAAAGISWWKWTKFIFPLLIAWTLIGCVYLMIAHFIGWGPF